MTLRRWWARLRAWWNQRPVDDWLGTGGSERHRRGWQAEDYALSRLTREGFHILGRNVRIGPGEIDIVAEEDGVLAFVEVRSREEGSLRTPAQTLTAEKRRRMMRCGEAYMRRHGLRGTRHRYDIAEVYYTPQGKLSRIEILRDAGRVRKRRRGL